MSRIEYIEECRTTIWESAEACAAAIGRQEISPYGNFRVLADPEPPAPPGPPPPGLDSVIGNGRAVQQLRLALDAFTAGKDKPGRAKAFPHTLMAGGGGLGKTTLAGMVGRELGATVHEGMGKSVNMAKAIALLTSVKSGDVIFLDEIHALAPVCQELFYRAMEDGLLVTDPNEPPVKLKRFTLIGATTDEWKLSGPLRQRFKLTVRMEFLDAQELTAALELRVARLGWTADADVLAGIAKRARGTPRLAIGLLDACRRAADARGQERLTADALEVACRADELDELGLDAVYRRYMQILALAAGPVKLNVLASVTGLTRYTLERVIEPDLMRMGLLTKTDNGGRQLTPAGREHCRTFNAE